MINSFETSLSMFFAKTENIYELAQSERLQELYEMVIKEQDELIPEISKEKVPWLLRIYTRRTSRNEESP